MIFAIVAGVAFLIATIAIIWSLSADVISGTHAAVLAVVFIGTAIAMGVWRLVRIAENIQAMHWERLEMVRKSARAAKAGEPQAPSPTGLKKPLGQNW